MPVLGVRETDARWQALLQRDKAADGQFVYAVKTTGIYCRPSCGARRPLRRNVQFFAQAAQAESAGYRACLRCQPQQLPGSSGILQTVTCVCRRLEMSEQIPTLAELAEELSVSPQHLQKSFTRVVGLSPHTYAREVRAARLRQQLCEGESVTNAIYRAGYNASSRFYEESNRMLGMQAGQYREGGPGVTIYFALAECSLGHILVAQSTKGVCAILLGEDPETLLSDLQQRFRAAELVGADARYEQTVAQVIGLIEAPALGHQLPLDIRGTAFQRRVWEALVRVPPGQTVSYRELATSLGMPSGARAVASACAANPLAVAVPCHRVVRSDGGLSGYRWGIARKRELLERERQGVR